MRLLRTRQHARSRATAADRRRIFCPFPERIQRARSDSDSVSPGRVPTCSVAQTRPSRELCALLAPEQRQFAGPLQSFGGEGAWLGAVANSLDHIGREEREL
jgi:hypothetical protein